MQTKTEEVRQWLRKAHDDLAIAGRADDLFEPGCFHCQQAVEKLLKAYLLWHSSDPPKIHDLMLLLDLCQRLDGSFAESRDRWERLTGYAIVARYPSEVPPPTKEEFREALDAAEECWRSILGRLPVETHPPEFDG